MTLIELVIAILVLSLGTVAAFRAIDQGRRTTGEASARFLALQVALNRAEELRVAEPGEAARLPARVAMGGRTWMLQVTEEITAAGFLAARITVSATGMPGAQVVAYLPGDRAP